MKKATPEDITRYADMFAAIGTEHRLRITQLLLTAHPDGMVAGEIQAENPLVPRGGLQVRYADHVFGSLRRAALAGVLVVCYTRCVRWKSALCWSRAAPNPSLPESLFSAT